MGINVVLLKKVEKLGDAGDQVSVREGYARNFLLRAGLARLATEAAIKEAEAVRAEKAKEQEAKKQAALDEAKKVAGVVLELERKASKGKLFGSVRISEVVKLLKEKGFSIKKDQIKMDAIKEAGEHVLTIRFPEGISEKITLKVTDETK